MTRDFARAAHRGIGHVVHAPRVAFGVDEEGFTEDYAVVALDVAKLGPGFRGNVVDLGVSLLPSFSCCLEIELMGWNLGGAGTEIPLGEFMMKMRARGIDDVESFVYPFDRLFPLRGVLSNEQMLNPGAVDSYSLDATDTVNDAAVGSVSSCIN